MARLRIDFGILVAAQQAVYRPHPSDNSLGGSAVAGLFAALVLMIHSDLGVGLLQLGFKDARDLMFGSRLDVAFFMSPPTIAGLLLLAGIGLVLARWIDPARRPGWRLGVQLALLSCAASLAKGSVMAVAIAAAFLAALIEVARTKRWPGRWLGAGALLAASALPGTLVLALGSESYAGAMLRVAPADGSPPALDAHPSVPVVAIASQPSGATIDWMLAQRAPGTAASLLLVASNAHAEGSEVAATAAVFARAGWRVALADPSDAVDAAWRRLIDGPIEAPDATSILSGRRA